MASSFITIVHALNDEGISETYRNKVLEYSSELDRKNLPIIFSTEHLALLIGVSPIYLRSLIESRVLHYSGYTIKKKQGGHRWIFAPSSELKYIQNWIKINILDLIPVHTSANGFVKTRSILTNSQIHNNCEIVLNIDLYRFFDSINIKRIYGLFVRQGYIKNLAYDLALLLSNLAPDKYWGEIQQEGVLRTEDDLLKNILPQGSPASPVITNILCYKMDVRFATLANKLSCNYTRYADDITFSGKQKNIPSLTTLKKIIVSEGFYINEKKIKYLSKNKRQSVTGLVVNNKSNLTKEFLKEIDTHLFFCKRFTPRNHLEFLEKKGIAIKSNFKQWLLGKISFVNAIDTQKGKKYFAKFNEIEWEL